MLYTQSHHHSNRHARSLTRTPSLTIPLIATLPHSRTQPHHPSNITRTQPHHPSNRHADEDDITVVMLRRQEGRRSSVADSGGWANPRRSSVADPGGWVNPDAFMGASMKVTEMTDLNVTLKLKRNLTLTPA